MTLRLLILLFLLAFAPLRALAGVEQIPEKEFRELAEELSGKVNLFAEGWRTNPDAEFYGGTTRDYLYWLKGQFQYVHDHAQAAAEIKKLREMPVIDVRDFIVGDSDVDIISAQAGSLSPEQFGVRKIDFQSPDLLDLSTEIGKNEILQGYIPAEKVRLAHEGFHPATLGDGISEIYHGKLSVHFSSADDFAKSKYAQEGINHPILLALRYLRLQAINYYRSYGSGFPEPAKLEAGLDEASARAVREVIQKATESGELAPYLANNKFQSWLNGALQKAFRSYTNPTAALEYMKRFGVDELVARYPEKIEPLNQYVFVKHRDADAIKAALTQDKVNEAEFYRSPAEFFPDGYLYHGTRTEAAFRGIVFQGVLPSDTGMGGKGLYGVAEPDKGFSENWGGDKNRLLRLPVKPDAKIVDVTSGEGERIYKKLGKDYESFAEHFGVDIVRYPYTPQAFVVKNAQALGRAEGVHRKIMSLSELLEKAKTITKPEELGNLTSVNALNQSETELLWKSSKVQLEDVLHTLKTSQDPILLETLLGLRQFQDDPALLAEWTSMLQSTTMNPRMTAAQAVLKNTQKPSPAVVAMLEGLFKNSSPVDHLILRKVTGSGLPTPHITALVLDSLGGPYGFDHVPAFLAKVTLGDEELFHARDIFRRKFLHKENDKALDPIVQKIIDQPGRGLAEALLRHQDSVPEVKQWLMQQLKSAVQLEQTRVIWENLRLLIDYLPEDPETLDAVSGFAHKFFQRIVTRNVPADGLPVTFFASEASRLKKYPAVKRVLFDRLDSEIDDDIAKLAAGQILPAYALSPAEWVEYIQKENLDGSELKAALNGMPSSPEISRALVNKYILTYQDHLGSRGVLQAAIAAQSDQKEVGAYLKEMLSNERPYVLTNGYPRAKSVEVGDIFELIAKGGGEFDTELKEMSLTYLEKYTSPDSAFYNHLKENELLKVIPADDAVSLNRVRRLRDEKRLSQGCSKSFAALGPMQ